MAGKLTASIDNTIVGGYFGPLTGTGIFYANAIGRMATTVSTSGSGLLVCSTIAQRNAVPGVSGTGTFASSVYQNYFSYGGLNSNGQLSAATDFPAHTPTTSASQTSTTFTIPWWAKKIDIVCIGGGGGGQAGNAGYDDGESGFPGQWGAATITRGVDISWNSTTISVSPGGVGSYGPAPAGGAGGYGGTSTATVGSVTVYGAGGAGGNNMAGSNAGKLPYPITLTVNGRNYTAASVAVPCADPPYQGNSPGGGGGAGQGNFVGGGAGGWGSYGCVWACYYQ